MQGDLTRSHPDRDRDRFKGKTVELTSGLNDMTIAQRPTVRRSILKNHHEYEDEKDYEVRFIQLLVEFLIMRLRDCLII